jgi:Rrf2 family protein
MTEAVAPRTRGITDPAGRISRVIFSSKAEYGVRLMVELGRQTPDQPTSLKAIAEAERLPLAYLEQVVARLKKAGLVMSARGAHGGYWLARPAAEITMDEVVQALEGAIAPMECFVSEHTERVLCSHDADAGHQHCATKLLWMRVQGGIARALQTTTLADLVEFSLRETPAAPAIAPPAIAPHAVAAGTTDATTAAVPAA